MIKMNEPNVTFTKSLQMCKEGITGNNDLLLRLGEGEEMLHTHAESYRIHGLAATLFTISPAQGENPLVVKSLTKNNLTKLYESYFVKKEKPARRIYDQLLASANEKCPFCGGIGRPRNLDHFLPKAHFPEFSVLPLNLIPSCRDCNMDGKKSDFAEVAEKQILHPFLDKPHFFEQQWLFAHYVIGCDGEPNTIRYYVDPPNEWSDTDKARVRQHFKAFDLAKRFAIQTTTDLPGVEAQYAKFRDIGCIASFKEAVLQPVIDDSPFINYWKRVMYLALLNHF